MSSWRLQLPIGRRSSSVGQQSCLKPDRAWGACQDWQPTGHGRLSGHRIAAGIEIGAGAVCWLRLTQSGIVVKRRNSLQYHIYASCYRLGLAH